MHPPTLRSTERIPSIKASYASEPTEANLDAEVERGNDRGTFLFFSDLHFKNSFTLLSKPLAVVLRTERSSRYDITATTSNLSPKICSIRLHDLTSGWLRQSSEVYRDTAEGHNVSLQRREWDHGLFLRLGRDSGHRQGTSSRDRWTRESEK
ncbi:hypothetical protein BDP81DRAFT_90433 [Colletotrichum phormii]|uniref:Uncharacterized protein n=1 Tax=Colletotrichum phormii TaxID=359342 RepID=A0AAJ0A1W4_9PEZI|nr:uncharacterized protein BDP81DRAFT_90433 [Colletotrichum phormii]KAK1654891.1 hypothetical protein BDP81DRAFT_90433 [Colletotrichum phormii]